MSNSSLSRRPTAADHGPYETEDDARLIRAVRVVYEAARASDRRGAMDELNHRMLDEACTAAGVELGAYDHRILLWLAVFEPQMCAVFAGLIHRAREAGKQAAAAEGDRLGFVVATFNQASGLPGLDYPDLYDGITDAICERDRKQEDTATTGRRERHVIAEVIEMEGNG